MEGDDESFYGKIYQYLTLDSMWFLLNIAHIFYHVNKSENPNKSDGSFCIHISKYLFVNSSVNLTELKLPWETGKGKEHAPPQ